MEINSYQQASNIWLEHQDRINTQLISLTQDAESSKEISQEVLMKLYRSCCSGRQINNLNAWLARIARNTAIDFLKKQNIKTSPLSPNDMVQEESVYNDTSIYLPILINFLPAKYAQALILADLEQLPQKEVASIMGLSLSATKSRIQRARKLLKQEILTCFYIERDAYGRIDGFLVKDSCHSLKGLKNC